MCNPLRRGRHWTMLPTTDTTEASVGSGLALHAAAALLLLLHPDHRDAYCMRMGFLQGVGAETAQDHQARNRVHKPAFPRRCGFAGRLSVDHGVHHLRRPRLRVGRRRRNALRPNGGERGRPHRRVLLLFRILIPMDPSRDAQDHIRNVLYGSAQPPHYRLLPLRAITGGRVAPVHVSSQHMHDGRVPSADENHGSSGAVRAAFSLGVRFLFDGVLIRRGHLHA
mmetsp:Transcript_3069/g.7290  ORF Transcript_3069/g.7290 Transcript_3069/m.7290 type:complete len:224 (+) Transcript_3069:99-770(+)